VFYCIDRSEIVKLINSDPSRVCNVCTFALGSENHGLQKQGHQTALSQHQRLKNWNLPQTHISRGAQEAQIKALKELLDAAEEEVINFRTRTFDKSKVQRCILLVAVYLLSDLSTIRICWTNLMFPSSFVFSGAKF
jgi:hypothetical protein